MRRIARAFKQVWRLSVPYWFRSEERLKAWLLLIADIAAMVVAVMANVRFNRWYMDWTNAFVGSNYALWKQQLVLFLFVVLALVLAAAARIYIEGWLTISWRNWMTARYLDNWMEKHNHYRMQVTGSVTDNPDQRIQEDINMFITNAITLSLSLLQQLIMLFTFIVILWELSSTIPLYIGGRNWAFPGYFIVVGLVWAFITTFLVHTFGKQLVRLNYNQQRYEADFRFSLVRVRENSEQISLLNGEPVEHSNLMRTFGGVIANTFRVIARQMKMQLWNTTLTMLNGLIISIMLGPSYFAGGIPGGYGAIMQVSSAFQNVIQAFAFFQTSYPTLVVWKAVINRLYDFLENAKKCEEILATSEVKVKEHDRDEIKIDDLDIKLPSGRVQCVAKNIVIRHGDKVLIKGKTGAGKTTLFRVIADIWPFGRGEVLVPKNKKVMVLPQSPYIPIGTLADAICYPEPSSKYRRAEIEQALRDVGLGAFVPRLDEVAHWNHVLSGGEQQRVGVARALLYRPDYLFFDEATASIDEPSEETLYNILLERLKDSTIVSIGHRSSLEKFHKRIIVAEEQPSGNYKFVERAAVAST